MIWRLAKSLETLRAQVNDAYPNRSKTSDGTIGDDRHAATTSDHNPNTSGVVTAIDITHDPEHGLIIAELADALRKSQDPRIKYVICNARIFSSKTSPWEWRPYSGANAHSKHIHVSVMADPALYDDQRPWSLAGKPVMQPVAKAPNFRSIVGGYFSSTPFDTSIPTSIRTNNPGALNASPWVKAYPGYVGDKVTSMSGASANNTAIFETPEQGVAAWHELMKRYAKDGAVTVKEIITKYGGGQDYSAYLDFVTKKTSLSPNYQIVLTGGDDSNLTKFAKAMWRYEAGKDTPLSDKQIAYGFNLARKSRGNVAGGGAAVVIVGGGTAAANEAQKAGWHPFAIGMLFVGCVALAIIAFVFIKRLRRQ